MKSKKIYMAVTTDMLELPIFVTDSAKEITEHFKITKNNFFSQIAHKSSGRNKGYRFVAVEMM